MDNNDVLVNAANDYERFRAIADEQGYKFGWIWYKMKEKYGEEISRRICPNRREDDIICDPRDVDKWEQDN